MKKTILSFALIITLVLLNTNGVYAADLEKGNPVGDYRHDSIDLPDGQTIELKDNQTLLFINGTLAADHNLIIRNDRSLVPVRLISQELGGVVDWDGNKRMVTIQKNQDEINLTINKDKAFVNDKEITLDYPAILYNDLTYVPLRFVAENLNATVKWAPRLGDEYKCYYDTKMPISPADTIIRDFPNIIIDEKYDSEKAITKDKAMEKAKETCMEGLENFKESTIKNLIDAGENPERLDEEFKSIEKEINRMMYIGEISRYYKFTIGPYDILYDKYNENIFFQKYSSATIVEKVDINDKALYMDIFIVG